jgi:hypothetical protein
MKFLVYETTNKANGKRYRGAHRCTHENCTYLGSGKLFTRALKKYGTENFERIILAECSSEKEMYEAEAQLVTTEWVADPLTYNVKVGGEGGWDYINRTGARWTEEKKIAWAEEVKRRHAEWQFTPKSPPMLGRRFNHSDEAKAKIAKASRLDQEVVEQRLRDVVECNYPARGSIQKLSKRWDISHTQVRRFLDEYQHERSV